MENEPMHEGASDPSAFPDDIQRSAQEIEDRLLSTRDRVHDLNEKAVRFIQERPAAAIGVAFGVGYIIGKLAAKRWLV